MPHSLIRLGALTLLTPQHANGTPTDSVVVAALHWRRSLTWRWLLSWSPASPIVIGGHRYPRIYGMRTHRGRGFNFIAGVRIPLLGHFAIHTQPNMRRRGS
jgi:hypothetical protein